MKKILIIMAAVVFLYCSGTAQVSVGDSSNTGGGNTSGGGGGGGSTPTAVTPSYSPVAATYGATQNVTISTTTGAATICYSTSATPVCNGAKTGCTTGTVYASTVAIPATATLQAIACKSGYNDSAAASGTYTIDTTAPTVSSTAPADASTAQANTATITVNFSEPVATGTISASTTTSCTGSIQVSANSFSTCVAMTSATAVFSNGNASVTYTPAANLTGNTTYKILVTTVAKDVYNNALAATYTTGTGFTVDSYVTTFAGDGTAATVDGTGTGASFFHPYGIAIDSSDNIYVTENNHYVVRKITPAGVVSNWAGSGSSGSTDATGTGASFNNPRGLAVDTAGNVYVADTGNNKIRKISTGRVVTTLAGSGTAGATDGTDTGATFSGPQGLVVDGSGNVFVADTGNCKIRKITSGGVVTTLAGSGSCARTDGTGTGASFLQPLSITLLSGVLYVGDAHSIRAVDPSGGVTATVSGQVSSGYADAANGQGMNAQFNFITGLAPIPASTSIYVADSSNNRIRLALSSAGGQVSTVSGGSSGYADGQVASGQYATPYGIARNSTGSLFITDFNNNRIRRIN